MTEALQAQDKRLTNIFFKQDGKILMDFIWAEIKVWLHPFKFCCYQSYRTANFETVFGIFKNTLLLYVMVVC